MFRPIDETIPGLMPPPYYPAYEKGSTFNTEKRASLWRGFVFDEGSLEAGEVFAVYFYLSTANEWVIKSPSSVASGLTQSCFPTLRMTTPPPKEKEYGAPVFVTTETLQATPWTARSPSTTCPDAPGATWPYIRATFCAMMDVANMPIKWW